jgi:hypothetical protein
MESERITIVLPDLNTTTAGQEIVADNIRAMEPIYFAAMLEEIRAFQVVDRLVELFQKGLLPIGQGRAANRLFKYWKAAQFRISETERSNLYARVLGFPGGDDNGSANREFKDLWLRFVSEVSSFARQHSVADRERAEVIQVVSQEQLKRAARDLAGNLSLYGYGWAYFASRELQKQINDVIRLLSDPEIESVYGARDMWQVISQVSQLELGGARNTVRYRTLATSGAIIIGWLAKNLKKLSDTTCGSILATGKIGARRSRRTSSGLAANPSDSDLVSACHDWLSVSGVPEDLST